MTKLAILVLTLAACFIVPLSDLVRFAWSESLFSHVLLVPFISAFLIWTRRGVLSPRSGSPALAALIPALMGLGLLLGYALARVRGFSFREVDYLAITIGAFVCLVIAAGLWVLGQPTMRLLAFPFGFLFFMVPFPAAMTHVIELFFQHASAAAAHLLFQISGTSLLREGMIFRFAGLSIEVAQECSGIRSSLVLFLTSLVAGHLLLANGWTRWLLALAVVPLAIIRNAFRIFSLVMLTLHVHPGTIHSPLHTQGGPLFFLLSLIPFFLLLHWLRRREQREGSLGRAGESPAPAP